MDFVIDQALHVSVLAAIAFHVADGASIEAVLQHERFSDGVLVVFAYVLILKPTSIVIGAVLNKYPIVNSAMDTDTDAVTDTDGVAEPVSDKTANVSGLVAGGELIGYLERLLILTFMLVGSYAAVGFVFGELNQSANRSMTEYVLIGSLISVVITTLIGALVSLGVGIKFK
jgi:Flp pilus assembly pilin Flp